MHVLADSLYLASRISSRIESRTRPASYLIAISYGSLSSVLESEMGSSLSAASERWRYAARSSACRCALAGSSKFHGIHCDIGVDFSPVWRSCC